MDKSNTTAPIWWFVLIALILCLSLTSVLIVQFRLPSKGQMTYAKYGCIPNDPSKREWDQYMGFSTCR